MNVCAFFRRLSCLEHNLAPCECEESECVCEYERQLNLSCGLLSAVRNGRKARIMSAR